MKQKLKKELEECAEYAFDANLCPYNFGNPKTRTVAIRDLTIEETNFLKDYYSSLFVISEQANYVDYNYFQYSK